MCACACTKMSACRVYTTSMLVFDTHAFFHTCLHVCQYEHVCMFFRMQMYPYGNTCDFARAYKGVQMRRGCACASVGMRVREKSVDGHKQRVWRGFSTAVPIYRAYTKLCAYVHWGLSLHRYRRHSGLHFACYIVSTQRSFPGISTF